MGSRDRDCDRGVASGLARRCGGSRAHGHGYHRRRPRDLLFAQTSSKERIELSGASICVGERILFGSYSASVDVQKQSADLVFSGKLPLDLLISHRMPLARIHDAFQLATKPTAESLKIVVTPQVWGTSD